jgi:proline iminopeptidase
MNRRGRARPSSRYHRRVSALPLLADPPLLRTHELAVSGGHVLQVQEFGAPDGVPAAVLHGGPGSGSSPILRRGFDGDRYRLICIDQRGSGASRPRGSIEHNTTADLLADLRLVREHLGVARWLVSGGSWGASLAIAHAAAEPEVVTALLLRSSFLARRQDIDDFFGAAAAAARPRAWQRLCEAVTLPLLPTLARMLAEGGLEEQQRAATAWWAWEQALAVDGVDAPPLLGDALARQVDRLRVQSHYLLHDCWLDAPPLLERCDALPQVPTLLLHARDDLVCPGAGALALAARLPHARLQWLAEGGHDAGHPLLTAATAAALARYAAAGDFGAAQ